MNRRMDAALSGGLSGEMGYLMTLRPSASSRNRTRNRSALAFLPPDKFSHNANCKLNRKPRSRGEDVQHCPVIRPVATPTRHTPAVPA